MSNLNHVSVKGFYGQLKTLLKNKQYWSAVWPAALFTIIFGLLYIVTAGIGLSFLGTVFTFITQYMMYIMYGLISPIYILMYLIPSIVGFVAAFFVLYWYTFILVSFMYSYQDVLREESDHVTVATIWKHFRHLRKNQILRISLYQQLFTFLWILPFEIINLIWGTNAYISGAMNVLILLVALWKALQYAQSYFLYREKQPAFVGQSMRHALTGSKRYMYGLKFNYLWIELLYGCLPVAVWSAILGGLAYYGAYTATDVWLYLGLALVALGILFYLPTLLTIPAVYFETSKKTIKVDTLFEETFTPVEILAGQAFKEDYQAPKSENKKRFKLSFKRKQK
ncbi:hypothetical protein [uncultured Limosilactobacillus sp.]|uniref:hypothetical protein n=1 Tax=uncultured Limosilactobacillus sp. TaxID=2837629 RepID=UPI0025D9B608|nr:hypothetical protein [uncultured Limosilactobacillus sp.]